MKIRLKSSKNILLSPIVWILLSLVNFSITDVAPSIPNEAVPAGSNPSQNKPKEEKVVIVNNNIDQVVHNSELNPSDIVHSSFEEPVPRNKEKDDNFKQLQNPFTDSLSQNSGLQNDIADLGQEILVTLVDTATAEIQHRVDISSQQQHSDSETLAKNTTNEKPEQPEAVAEQDRIHENITSHHNDLERNKSDEFTILQQTEKILELPKIMEPKQNLTEEIPSFSEWSQIQMEERKLREANSTTKNSKIRVRNKNYASPDCGAKIVAANAESVSAHSVLTPSRDEYKLNTCTTPKIWFIVELCEAIQAKKIEMANFELFSSSPKDFTVSVSDRFPTREWSNVGQFIAKDERVAQSFELHPHLFGKYIKVELHSHYGTEHFCPVSIFKVYGTSEFEVLEKEDQPNTNNPDDDDDDETVDSEKGENAQNLFSSAKDAVISIVKKAAEVLGKGNQSNQTNDELATNQITYSPLISTCTTPSHLVVCTNCSDLLFGQVYELLSCRARELNNLLAIEPIKNALYNTQLCVPYGFTLFKKSNGGATTADNTSPAVISSYVKSFFSARYIGALCNTVAIIENKVVHNVSNNNTYKENNDFVQIDIESTPASVIIKDVPVMAKTEQIPTQDHLNIAKTDVASINSAILANDLFDDLTQINPTKTLTHDQQIVNLTYNNQLELEDASSSSVTSSSSQIIIHETNIVAPLKEMQEHEQEHIAPPPPPSVDYTNIEASGEMPDEEPTTVPPPITTPSEAVETLDLDNIISDLTSDPPININSAQPPQPQIKESVFLRLSNRIKALERNMSLSSQYLEELSRRYKKQVEEMQRLLERTIITLNEESKRKDEANQRLEEKLNQLNEIIAGLVADKNNFGDYFTPIFFALVIAIFVLFKLMRRTKDERLKTKTTKEVQRRKSIDVINHTTPIKKERRPSEEILKISGTYEHLLVHANTAEGNHEWGKQQRKQKRKKKKLLRLSQENIASKSTSDIIHKATSNRLWNRQENLQYETREWDGLSNGNHTIEDIPFVLEECDNSPLQDMPLPKPLREDVSPSVEPIMAIKSKFIPVRKISSPAYLKSQNDTARKMRRTASPSQSGSGSGVSFTNDLSTSGVLDVLHKAPPTMNGRGGGGGHKKTSSVDFSIRRKEGDRSSPAQSTDGNVSLDTDLDADESKTVAKVGNGDSANNGRAPKKDKRGTLKRIFRKVF